MQNWSAQVEKTTLDSAAEKVEGMRAHDSVRRAAHGGQTELVEVEGFSCSQVRVVERRAAGCSWPRRHPALVN
eukprot:COSAG02_NODE_6235_length_3707_cov_2.136364_3_plen_73_part_00